MLKKFSSQVGLKKEWVGVDKCSMSRVLRVLDSVSGAVLLLMAVLAPWMLGATTRETIWALNGLGFLSGGLWFVQSVVRSRASASLQPLGKSPLARWPMACVGFLLITLLSYVLCSALNPKASLQYTFTPGYSVASGVEIDYLDPIAWLPQSHDRDRTVRAFWKYLAIVFSFVAARDWLMGASRRERRSDDGTSRFPGDRMQWMLWTLAINAAAVALVGMLQRLDGTQQLLWAFANHLNGGHGAFGPFPYRSNGAQYLNLMWPVTLGFWWVLRRRNVARRSVSNRSGGDPHVLLLVLGGLTAAGVVVANSRGGFLVLVGLLVAVFALVMFWSKRQVGFRLGVVAAISAVLGVGGWLGGEAMMARFRSEDLGRMSGRKLIYEDTARMAQDFAVFGSGAETFAPLYYFYRQKDPEWNAYVHDDYLETRVTFGTVGFVIIVLIFLAVWLVPFFGNGIPASPEFILLIGVAMVGILIHAKSDLPFQIYSIHSQFVLLCAVLTSLKWQGR
jgi:O-antigen ligase